MIKKHKGVKGTVNLSSGEAIKFVLPLILFEEDGATICYCPAIDLSGYGKNETEAMKSYQISIGEYFLYTARKKTLKADLTRLGWTIKKSLSKKMIPPTMSKSLETNENFSRIFNNFDFKKIETNVKIPVLD